MMLMGKFSDLVECLGSGSSLAGSPGVVNMEITHSRMWRYQENKDREKTETQKEQQVVRVSRASNTSRVQLGGMEWKTLQTGVRTIHGSGWQHNHERV